ncbi:hypothetical protein CYMTET_23215, partial [Cymbomonas tetramitiformis]
MRARLLESVAVLDSTLFTTSASVASVAEMTRTVLAVPSELTNETQAQGLQLVNRLIADTMEGEAQMKVGAARSVLSALSSLNEVKRVDASTAAPRRLLHSGLPADVTGGVAARAAEGIARSAECQASARQLTTALLVGAVDGEAARKASSPTMAISGQRCRAGLRESCLYDAPHVADGASARIPWHPLGQASAGRAVNRTAAESCTSTSQLAQSSVQVRILRMATEVHDAAVQVVSPEEGARTAVAASGTMTASLLDTAGNNSELQVTGLCDGVVIDVALNRAYSGVTVAEVEAWTGSPWSGRLVCEYWDTTNQSYSSEGCAALPNPVPPGAGLHWRTTDTTGYASLDMMWAVGSEALTAGCVETWDPTLPEYAGGDAGYRKYGRWRHAHDVSAGMNATSAGLAEQGSTTPAPVVWEAAGCALVDPGNNVTAACVWDWTRQRFVGSGCVVAAAQSCLCTHLTDFRAAHVQQEVEPPQLSTVTADEMVSVSLTDVADSMVLLALVFGIISAAGLLSMLSAWGHAIERQRLLETLVLPYGTGALGFRRVAGRIWTWGIFEEDLHYPSARMLSWQEKRRAAQIGRAEMNRRKQLMTELREICEEEEEGAGKRARGRGRERGSEALKLDQRLALNFPGEGVEGTNYVRTPALQRTLARLETSSRLISIAQSFLTGSSPQQAYRVMGGGEEPEPVGKQRSLARRPSSTAAAALTKMPDAPQPARKLTGSALTLSVGGGRRAASPSAGLSDIAWLAPHADVAGPVGLTTLDPLRSPEADPTGDKQAAGALYEVAPCAPGSPLHRHTVEAAPWQKERPVAGTTSKAADRLPELPQRSGVTGGAEEGAEEDEHRLSDAPQPQAPGAMRQRANQESRASSQGRMIARVRKPRSQARIAAVRKFSTTSQQQYSASVTDAVESKRLQRSEVGLVGVKIVQWKRFSSLRKGERPTRFVSRKPKRAVVPAGRAPQRILRLRCAAVFIRGWLGQRDLRSTVRLCSAMHVEPTALALSIPIHAFRDLKAKTAMHPQPSSMQDSPPSSADSRHPDECCKGDILRGRHTIHDNERLPLERLLGTALVLAFLETRGVVHSEQVKSQLALMERTQEWAQPLAHLGITEYVGLFKAMLDQKSSGWLQEALLWNLALLQDAEGAFDLTDGIAMALHAGSNTVELLSMNSVPAGSASDVLVLLPQALRQAAEAQGLSEQCTARLWATMLAEAKLGLLSVWLTWSPEAEKPEADSVGSRAAAYVRAVCNERPGIRQAVVEAQASAEAIVRKWHRARMDAMAQLRSQ